LTPELHGRSAIGRRRGSRQQQREIVVRPRRDSGRLQETGEGDGRLIRIGRFRDKSEERLKKRRVRLAVGPAEREHLQAVGEQRDMGDPAPPDGELELLDRLGRIQEGRFVVKFSGDRPGERVQRPGGVVASSRAGIARVAASVSIASRAERKAAVKMVRQAPSSCAGSATAPGEWASMESAMDWIADRTARLAPISDCAAEPAPSATAATNQPFGNCLQP
jgi:hypothetical protein